jgi:hypothetical protein
VSVAVPVPILQLHCEKEAAAGPPTVRLVAVVCVPVRPDTTTWSGALISVLGLNVKLIVLSADAINVLSDIDAVNQVFT